jgi:hypothetical protein
VGGCNPTGVGGVLNGGVVMKCMGTLHVQNMVKNKEQMRDGKVW